MIKLYAFQLQRKNVSSKSLFIFGFYAIKIESFSYYFITIYLQISRVLPYQPDGSDSLKEHLISLEKKLQLIRIQATTLRLRLVPVGLRTLLMLMTIQVANKPLLRRVMDIINQRFGEQVEEQQNTAIITAPEVMADTRKA